MALVNEVRIMLTELAETATGFRKSAFQKALKSLQNYKGVIISREEMKKLEGVGDGIMKRFDELVMNGEVKEIKENMDKNKVLQLFQGIYGVGPVLASKFYESGHRTLDDLSRVNLTYSQGLGLKYYHDINSKISRKEVAEIEQALNESIPIINQALGLNLRAKVCGSYLRGKAQSGDVDIILSDSKDKLHDQLNDVMVLFEMFFISHVLARGKSKVLCLGGIGKGMRRIDFELVKDREWPYALMYFTGSKNFNKYSRGIASQKGMLLNHAGLFLSNGDLLEVQDEREIFNILDIKYLTPAEREEVPDPNV